MHTAIYLLAFGVLLVGLYAVVAKRNLVKIIVGVLIIDYAVNLILLLVGYRSGGQAPIVEKHQAPEAFAASAVDPLPQAMILTSIVIGLGLTALMVAMAVRLHEKYGTFDVGRIRKLKG